MFDTLLPTKLYMPPGRAGSVPRPRLQARLVLHPQTRLILISAPAGYGKTTLVSDWLQQLDGIATCWLALDKEDSDPQQFFRYLAAAVAPLPGVQSSLIRLLEAGQPLPAHTLMKALVQDTTAVSTPFILVLDDYHAIDAPEIDAALAALLDHMPPQMALAITSRSDPGFPLARLRARDQLIELRADDLRFTPAETAAFLQQTMGLTLTAGEIAALENRTEGWIAGLQMAAISLQNRSDSEQAAFVRGFTGSNRFVLDYLVEETLQQQPADVRTFLLATAILDRLSAPLCTAVTALPDARRLLETLEHKNLFLVPLDDQRQWFRYHHLFAEVLQARARAEQPAQVARWHRRAAAWHAQYGAPTDAIRHALAAGDFPEAARLLELVRPDTDGIYPVARWLGWTRALPEALIQERPVLCAGYGWALLESGDLAAGAARLQQAEQWLASPSSAMVIADPDQWETLPASLAGARAYHALALGDVATAVEQARRAFDFFAADQDTHWQRMALSLLGVAYWISGDLDAAIEAFGGATRSMLAAGQVVDAMGTTYVQAEMEVTQGRLNRAAYRLQEMLQRAVRDGSAPLLGTSDLYRLLAWLAWERGAAETAVAHLATAVRLGEEAALINWEQRLYVTWAQITLGQGDLDRALALLDEAERRYVENPLPEVRPVPALRARVWIAQGELEMAAAWAQAQGLSPRDAPDFLREFEHLTLARLLLARYRRDGDRAALDAAERLLARLLAAAEAGGRNGSAIEILALQALACAARGDVAAARPPLLRALTLAQPEGYLRLFVDAGAPMVELLAGLRAESHPVQAYVTGLLAAFEARDIRPPSDAAQPLVDPLSERELEILALIAAGLKNREIAAELVISLNTVLYHTKNIYGKLGVNKRTLAIARARQLGLL